MDTRSSRSAPRGADPAGDTAGEALASGTTVPRGTQTLRTVAIERRLVWPREQVWWEVTDFVTPSRFAFRWPWDADESLVTQVTISLQAEGAGTRLLLTDGPFPIDRPGGLDAWAEALEGWGEALTLLRGYVDFSVDLRDRP